MMAAQTATAHAAHAAPRRAPPLARLATRQVLVALDGEAPMTEAARVMAELRIGSVGVREGGDVVGLVTERDLVYKVLASAADAARPMRDVMRRLPRVSAEASEADCAALMRDHATRHLLVEDRGEVVGVVSMSDLIERMLEEKQSVIEQLNAYITGY